MKALATLSKFTGCYDVWKDIVERYKLKWSSDDTLYLFHQMTDTRYNIDSMMRWLNETRSALPASYANILVFNTLVGLRPQESISSINLIKEKSNEYFQNQESIIQHYKFPTIFLRRTKKAYISIMIRPIIDIAHKCGNHSYNALRLMIHKNGLQMNMSYCRKIFATHLRNDGIEPEFIDLLQGRLSESVFVKHYFRPDFPLQRIQKSISKLHERIAEK
jgi:hypothetical protein